MILDDRVCVNCNVTYTPKAHNSCYCSLECRRQTTNARVLERYYENKRQRDSKEARVCGSKQCETILSRYNRDKICELCKEKRFRKRLKKWGWSDAQIEEKLELLES